VKIVVALVATLALAACQSSNPVKLVFPEETQQEPNWTEAELEKSIAIHRLYSDANASTFIIRLNGSERPHYHDHHGLNVSTLSGNGRIHFKDHAVSLSPGDVVFIPKGTYHWAENTGPEAALVFAVFSPEFVGKDKRFVDQEGPRRW